MSNDAERNAVYGDTYRNSTPNSGAHNARNWLLVLGIIGIAIGVIMIVNGNTALAHDGTVNDFESSMGMPYGTGNTSGDWWLIGAGIGVLVLGVGFCAARLIISAARR